MTMMEKMGGYHDPSTCRDMGRQGYRDQGCLEAGIQGSGMQAADTLPQWYEKRKELWETPGLTQRTPPRPPGTALWVQILHGPTLCGAQRKWGHTT